MIRSADLPPSLIAAVKKTNPTLETDEPATLPTLPDSALYPLHRPETPRSAMGDGGEEFTSEPVLPLKTFLREQEHSYLNRTLQQCGGDKEKAALQLGVSLATLYRKLSGEDKEV